MAKALQLPNEWQPRGYQMPAWSYLEGGGKRVYLVWHRRAGKDEIFLHWTAVAAHQRVATYWYMLPEQAQARKAIWDAVNPHTGMRRIDEAFPKELRRRTVDHEMFIEFKNGSMWHVVGSDNYDRLVGSPPAGVVFSEWALAKPSAWAYLRPILLENGGWAAFNLTPRGRNHAFDMYEYAEGDDEWLGERLTVEDTNLFTAAQLRQELRELQNDYGEDEGRAHFEQEYFCSFDASIMGSIYGPYVNRAQADGRITSVPIEANLPVSTCWDIGYGDNTAIWFFQQKGPQIRFVHYYQNHQKDMGHYLAYLEQWQRAKEIVWGTHHAPHDFANHWWGTGGVPQEQAELLGFKFQVVPRMDVDKGINAVRVLFPRFWFDNLQCRDGIEALRQYRYKWDEKQQKWSKIPVHDWASDGADSIRYGALGIQEVYGVARDPADERYDPTFSELIEHSRQRRWAETEGGRI